MSFVGAPPVCHRGWGRDLVAVSSRGFTPRLSFGQPWLELVGERWSLLIIRDALFRGMVRFAEFQHSLGLATNVLATRLESFVAAGIMERRGYSSHHDHYEYALTEKGVELAPVVIALSASGDRWAAPNGPPILYRHAGCCGQVDSVLMCGGCRQPVAAAAIQAQPGPGSRSGRSFSG